jgi:hypothetical protein
MSKINLKVLLSTLLIAQPISGSAADVNNVFGVWGSVTLQGDFTALSPNADKFKWFIMNQTRTRDDSPEGTRFTENILFSQVGYQFNEHASLWLGYAHDWINPFDKPALNENRAYQDFIWKQTVGDFKLISRTRMDERFLEGTNEAGYRPRQLLMVRHPLPFMDGLSAYLGDEILFYLTKNVFGKQGFSENRIFTGLSYTFTQHIRMDMGYMGQYVDTKSGSNLFTHNLQANIGYKF